MQAVGKPGRRFAPKATRFPQLRVLYEIRKINIRILIILSIVSYLVSFAAIATAGAAFSRTIDQLLLVVSYLPFFVILIWASLIGLNYFNHVIPVKNSLIAFGVNSVVFIGWVTVMLVHFSIFRPHV